MKKVVLGVIKIDEFEQVIKKDDRSTPLMPITHLYDLQ